jgi:hypothetical protein
LPWLDPPDLDELKRICGGLNSDKPQPWVPELRRLLKTYFELGRSLPESEWRILVESAEPKLLFVRNTGRFCLWVDPKRPWDPDYCARYFFVRFTMNPDFEKLGGPCPRLKKSGVPCGRFFIRAGFREKRYCSRECASSADARTSTVRKRAEEHRVKLEAAKRGIAEFNRLPSSRRARTTWKDYVARSDRAAGISKKFLTRAVNRGELQPPIERRS